VRNATADDRPSDLARRADQATISVADLAKAGALPVRWAPHQGGEAVLGLWHQDEQLELPVTVRVDLAWLRLDLGATAMSSAVQVILHRRLLQSQRGQPRGRWYMTAPCCGRRCLMLALARPADGAGAAAWACRHCAGLDPPARGLSSRQRLLRAAEKAADADLRRPKESLAAWRKRNRRALAVRRRLGGAEDRAASSLDGQIARLDDDGA
jgi:hypothetical protein